jgi:hypothetical protein
MSFPADLFRCADDEKARLEISTPFVLFACAHAPICARVFVFQCVFASMFFVSERLISGRK